MCTGKCHKLSIVWFHYLIINCCFCLLVRPSGQITYKYGLEMNSITQQEMLYVKPNRTLQLTCQAITGKSPEYRSSCDSQGHILPPKTVH